MPYYDPDLQCVWGMDNGSEWILPVEVVGRGDWPIKCVN
jgi:hypothetical protein